MSNNRILKSGLKNMIYAFLSQFISMILSFVTSFVLPFILDVKEFGYWQIYLFYFSYLPLFYIGFNDGIYLRYGDKNYEELPFKNIRSSVVLFLIIQLFVSVVGILCILFIEKDIDKKFVLIINMICLPISACSAISTSVLLVSNRIKQYTYLIIIGKVLLLVGITFITMFSFNNYKIIILVDFIVKLIISLLSIYYCKNIYWGKINNIKNSLYEFKNNVCIGIPLMVAMLMGTFLLGIGRIMIERYMGIEEYSMYSFAFSATNIVLVLVTSISVAIYPTLNRLDKDKIGMYFERLNTAITLILFFSLIIYYPMCIIVKLFYTKYLDILEFLFILFPIILCQAKIQIIINTYYKILRKEKIMLFANLCSILIFIIITVPIFYYYKSISLISITTLITSIILCYGSEIYLRNLLNINNIDGVLKEIFMIIVFLVVNRFLENIQIAMTVYIILYLIYAIQNKRDIMIYFNKIKITYIDKVKNSI